MSEPLRLGATRHTFDTLDSTNVALKRLAAEGAPLGTVVTARAQTAGYGQRGREWASAPESGLYMSVLLPFPATPFHLPFVVGLGCRDALAAVAPGVGLKWVNDLVAGGCKLGGILIELSGQSAVAGVGVNLRDQAVPESTSLEALGATVTAPQLLEALLEGIERRHAQWQAEGFAPIRADWAAASVTLGRRVRVLGLDAPLEGLAVGLGPDGELLVERPEGGVETVITGSVRAASGAYCD